MTFSQPLIGATAVNPANYALLSVGQTGKANPFDDTAMPMSVSMYQSSRFVVALTPSQPLPANRFFRLVINGGSGGARGLG